MPFVKDALQGDDRPYSLKGTFYHCHEDDKKFDRDQFGGYFRNGTTKYKKYLTKDRTKKTLVIIANTGCGFLFTR